MQRLQVTRPVIRVFKRSPVEALLELNDINVDFRVDSLVVNDFGLGHERMLDGHREIDQFILSLYTLEMFDERVTLKVRCADWSIVGEDEEALRREGEAVLGDNMHAREAEKRAQTESLLRPDVVLHEPFPKSGIRNEMS